MDEEAPGDGIPPGGLTSGPGGDQGPASRGAGAGQEGAQGRTCHGGAGGRNLAHSPASVNKRQSTLDLKVTQSEIVFT